MQGWVDEQLTNQHKGKFTSPRIYRERYYLQQYILILGNTGIRVGEARGLRWLDLSSVVGTNEEEDLVVSVKGKTGRRDVVANKGTERYFKRLAEFRTKELGKTPPLEEYIFCHSDGSSVNSYKKGYQNLLTKCGLRTTPDGEYRTLYSIRHTYATMRIKEVPIYQLSVNMGTSVKMIEEYYSHAKVKDPSFAKLMTKGNQRGSSKVLPF